MFDAGLRKSWAKRAEFAFTGSSLILMLAGLGRGLLPFLPDTVQSTVRGVEGGKVYVVGLITLSSLVMMCAWYAKSRLGPAAAWTTLQALCNKLQVEAFPQCKERNEPIDNYRVTLFRYQKRANRVLLNNTLGMSFWQRLNHWNGGWLVPVLRSGHTSRGTKAVFRAPKHERSSKAEGLAGQAWGRQNSITVSGLPELTSDSPSADVKQYAKLTYTNEERLICYVNNGKPLSRSFWACRLKMQGGQEWGVIVLDSLSPDEIDKQKVDEAFKWISEAATELLKEVS